MLPALLFLRRHFACSRDPVKEIPALTQNAHFLIRPGGLPEAVQCCFNTSFPIRMNLPSTTTFNGATHALARTTATYAPACALASRAFFQMDVQNMVRLTLHIVR